MANKERNEAKIIRIMRLCPFPYDLCLVQFVSNIGRKSWQIFTLLKAKNENVFRFSLLLLSFQEHSILNVRLSCISQLRFFKADFFRQRIGKYIVIILKKRNKIEIWKKKCQKLAHVQSLFHKHISFHLIFYSAIQFLIFFFIS